VYEHQPITSPCRDSDRLGSFFGGYRHTHHFFTVTLHSTHRTRCSLPLASAGRHPTPTNFAHFTYLSLTSASPSIPTTCLPTSGRDQSRSVSFRSVEVTARGCARYLNCGGGACPRLFSLPVHASMHDVGGPLRPELHTTYGKMHGAHFVLTLCGLNRNRRNAIARGEEVQKSV
jgi:hypothetical protein